MVQQRTSGRERYIVGTVLPAYRVIDTRTGRTVRVKPTADSAQLLADILNGADLPQNHSAYDRVVAGVAADLGIELENGQ
jgi:hypothetical protein